MREDLEKEFNELLLGALKDLAAAVAELQAEIFPSVPFPRPRVFQFAPGVTWPRIKPGGVEWRLMVVVGRWNGTLVVNGENARVIITILAERNALTPANVLRTVKAIEAAARWCRARRAGMERAAQEILRQQACAVDEIRARLAIRKLAEWR